MYTVHCSKIEFTLNTVIEVSVHCTLYRNRTPDSVQDLAVHSTLHSS